MSHKPVIELLAPARDIEVGKAAILAGADAVYIGAPSHGARSSAANSVAKIEELCNMAHQFGARVYATVNTLVYEPEIPEVQKLICELYHAGVDALIVQDLGILRMQIPPIDLHASTQCDIRDPEKAQFLVESGFSRVVPARELGLKEIQAIHEAISPLGGEIEAFCHGALCVSYSGMCRASLALTGRSGCRGECAQICRLPFDLVNDKGETLISGRHLLSLRDMNRLPCLGPMLDAGVRSFKIEGRLKDMDYVVNAVTAYRKALDAAMAPRGLKRSSYGISNPLFKPSLDKEFNRGFTSYFFDKPQKMGSHLTPAFAGEPLGEVKAINGKEIIVTLSKDVTLSNGDGLTYFDSMGKLQGFRVNRAEGDKLWLKDAVSGIRPGMKLLRNLDKAFQDNIIPPKRLISIKIVLRLAGALLCLDLSDERGMAVTATSSLTALERAQTDQKRPRRRLLEKVGGTIYHVREISDLVGNVFIPASVLASLRREAITLLDTAWKCTFTRRRRLKENTEVTLTSAENVSNSLAERFYHDHQAAKIHPAPETSHLTGEVLMTCRYCLRRELDKCLKQGAKPENWFLKAPGMELALKFDCNRCEMKVCNKS